MKHESIINQDVMEIWQTGLFVYMWKKVVMRNIYMFIVILCAYFMCLIDDILSINNIAFHNYLGQIYPTYLEIKDTKEGSTSAPNLDLLLSIGRYGQLRTLLTTNVTVSISISLTFRLCAAIWRFNCATHIICQGLVILWMLCNAMPIGQRYVKTRLNLK